MADQEVQSGDVVQLKSGGLNMTVGDYHTDGVYFCYWFDSQGQFHKELIAYEALKKVQPDIE